MMSSSFTYRSLSPAMSTLAHVSTALLIAVCAGAVYDVYMPLPGDAVARAARHEQHMHMHKRLLQRERLATATTLTEQ